MKERPILFSGPMVRALLAGTKTQTRRVVNAKAREAIQFTPDFHWRDILDHCPYGQPGDRLWVRETFHDEGDGRIFYRADNTRGLEDFKGWRPSLFMPRWSSRINLEVTAVRVERLQDISQADALEEGVELLPPDDEDQYHACWKNYLPKGTENFHVKGGLYVDWDDGSFGPYESYASLWESINGLGSWESNPWVWVVEFKRV